MPAALCEVPWTPAGGTDTAGLLLAADLTAAASEVTSASLTELAAASAAVLLADGFRKEEVPISKPGKVKVGSGSFSAGRVDDP